jgi:hypothetical protein
MKLSQAPAVCPRVASTALLCLQAVAADAMSVTLAWNPSVTTNDASAKSLRRSYNFVMTFLRKSNSAKGLRLTQVRAGYRTKMHLSQGHSHAGPAGSVPPGSDLR